MVLANLHENTEWFIDTRNLKQALKHGLVLKKVNKVIKFNQNSWLKPYVDMNIDLKQFLESLWKMCENVEMLNLSQQEEERII